MSEIFDRFMRVFITELGGIESQDDTEFLVTGNSNTNALYIYIPKSLDITLVRVSFTRNDGFTISDYQMNVNEGLADVKYNVYEYIFKNNDRVLEVGGRLQISFKLNKKTLIAEGVYIDKVISTPITCANVLRSISEPGDVELSQQLYEASLQPVETVEQALNTHRLDNNNPHKVNATQVKLDGTSQTTVAEKFTEVEQEITGVNQNLTTSINQVKTDLGNHTNNINNPHKVTANQVKMSDNTSTVEERITVDEEQINTNYESIQQNKSNIESHKADTNNPHGTTGVNAKIEKSSPQTIKDYVDNGLTNTLQQAKAYSDTKQSSKTSFVYETLQNFLENVKYTITNTTATLTKIIDEYGTEYPSNELQEGNVNVYLREQNVPDYWLSKKQVEITDVFDPLDFFLPLETEMNVDLTNYVTYSDYATSVKGGVVKVSAENGVKVDSNGQLSINPATAEEIQSGTGNKVITSSNLPNASQTNKGVVKLSSSFEINGEGNLDIPVVDIGKITTTFDYDDYNVLTLTDEQVAKIRNSDNILLKFNENILGNYNYYRHINMTRTGEIYNNNGELDTVDFASTSLSGFNGSGVFTATLDLPSKRFSYQKIRLWSTISNTTDSINFTFKRAISSNESKSVKFKTINNQAILGANGNIETSIKLSNTTVNNWESDATYADYPYKATVAATDVTSSMVAEVIYSVADATSGNYAPVCETFDGGVYIYSKVNTTITIPTVLVVK